MKPRIAFVRFPLGIALVFAAGCGVEATDGPVAVEQALSCSGGPASDVGCDPPVVAPVPRSSGDSLLYGLKTLGPTGFAVGYYWDTADICNIAGTRGSCVKPLVEMHDSGGWSYTLPPPPLPTAEGGAADLVNSWLYAVDGTSSCDVWALGTAASDDGPQLCAQDGDCDNAIVLSPAQAFNVPRNLRACGNNGHCIQYSDLIYHFDGTSWTRKDGQPGAKLTSDWGGPLLTVEAIAPDSVDLFGNGPPVPGYSRTQGIHWNGSAWSTIHTTAGAPGLVFTSLRLDKTDQWLGGDGDMWHRVGSSWATVPIPADGFSANCTNGYCDFFQINSLRRDAANPGQLWGVGTYADFNQGALDLDTCDDSGGTGSAQCNIDGAGPLTCSNGLCVGCTSDSVCPGGTCARGTCEHPTGLNQLYSAHYDGAAWSAVPVPGGDANQCLWSMAVRAYTGAAGPVTDVWAVGGQTADTVEINSQRNCLDFRARTVVEYYGTGSHFRWQRASQPSDGNFFGVDLLSAGGHGGTRVLAVGFRPAGPTLQALSQTCSANPRCP